MPRDARLESPSQTSHTAFVARTSAFSLFIVVRCWLLILQEDCFVQRHLCGIHIPDAEGADDCEDSEAQRSVIHDSECLSVGKFDSKLTSADDLFGDPWYFGICCRSVHGCRLDDGAETAWIETELHQSLLNLPGQQLLEFVSDYGTVYGSSNSASEKAKG